MGLEFIIRGYVSSQWEVIQNIYLGVEDYNTPATNWTTKLIKSIWNFSISMWSTRNDFVHGKTSGKKNSERRKELIRQIEEEMVRTSAHMEFTTKQLRMNVRKSIGNAMVPALEVWLRMLRNVKGEVYQKKQYDHIPQKRAQPITNFLVRRERT